MPSRPFKRRRFAMRGFTTRAFTRSAGARKPRRESRLLARRAASVAGAALLVVVLFAAARADANHIPGATYNGTVAGGTAMSLTVAPDGSGITSFTAAGPLDAGDCTFSDVTWTYSGTPLVIANHSFSDSDDPEMSVSGSFPAVQGAQGTVRVGDASSSCDTGNLAWSATTIATPDTTAPALQLGGATSQNVLRQRGVLVVATSAAEASTVTAKGKVVVRGSAKVFKLTPVTKQVSRGAKATLKLKLKKSARSAIGRALKAGKKLSAKVTVGAKDASGNVTTKQRTIRLKR
jgi:hypothetical protein